MIEVNNLGYRYRGETRPAVDSITFSVKNGEIFGFLGPSGAGKSTTQKVLIRLLSNYSGSARLAGNEISSLNEDFYNMVGVGFELPNHYPRLTALENLRFFASFYDKMTADPMELLRLTGLGEYANMKTSGFSKGMKMRLNFVRALVHDPELLFFDEPTSGLDPLNARIIKNIIKDLSSRGKTIFLTTHNMHDADELCDRVAFISNGRIALTDAPANLKLQHGTRTLKIEYGESRPLTGQFSLDGLAGNEEFLSIIRNGHIRSMHTSEATLEDIFIKTTGESLSGQSSSTVFNQ
jgi:fluoroquinolone transport system ATP-binding protein